MAEELTTSPEEETKEEVKEGQTEQQIIDQFEKEKKNYKQATQENRTEIQEIFKVYMGKVDEVQSTPYDTKESIPKLRTEVAYVKPFIFSGEPEIELEGVGDEDQGIAQILEKIVNYRLSQSIPNSYEKIEDWVHQAVTFGTSIIKVVWKFETKKEIGEDGQEFETPVIDRPELEVPNILDVFYNPMVPEIENQASLICRSVLTLEEVVNNPIYNYTDKEGVANVSKLKGKGKMTADAYDSSSQQQTDTLSNQEGMVEVYERYTNDRIQTIAVGDKTMVIRDIENSYGFINAVKFVFEKNTIPNVFDGLGVGQNTLNLGKSYYKLLSQTLTNVKMINNPMFLFTKGSRIDKKQLVSKPGGGIEVTTDGRISDSIEPVLFPDIKQGAIEMLNLIDDEHKRASGANDLVQGSASNDTLGQDEIAQANVSNRFELIVRRFKHALADVAQMIITMELQNLQSPDAEILRIFPEEIRQQVYELLINEAQSIKYNVKVKGDTNIARNKNLESKRLVDLFDLSQNFLTDQEKRAFIRKIAERQGMNNIDEIIGESNPMADQQEQFDAVQGQLPQQGYNQVGATGGQTFNQ